MKVLCLCSEAPGHIDFGGKGFIRLAKRLQSGGHHVTWAAYGAQIARLAQEGFTPDRLEAARSLSVKMQLGAKGQVHQDIRLDGFRQLLDYLSRQRPDLLLVDRLMAYAGPIADRLGIPYVAIGTPGGHWVRERQDWRVDVFPSATAVERYRERSAGIFEKLGWENCHIDGFWLDSPYLNTTFMGRDWYPKSGAPQAQVWLFETNYSPRPGSKKLGISFGNQGRTEALEEALTLAFQGGSFPLPVDVITGNRDDVARRIDALPSRQRFELYRWVNFGEHFRTLSALAFLGGIGTAWHCLRAGLPMLVIPGHLGDQLFNGRRVDSLGLGICFEPPLKPEGIQRAIFELVSGISHFEEIDYQRSRDAFSDDENSWCARVEALV
jgi:hypothetical protein